MRWSSWCLEICANVRAVVGSQMPGRSLLRYSLLSQADLVNESGWWMPVVLLGKCGYLLLQDSTCKKYNFIKNRHSKEICHIIFWWFSLPQNKLQAVRPTIFTSSNPWHTTLGNNTWWHISHTNLTPSYLMTYSSTPCPTCNIHISVFYFPFLS